MESAVVKEDNQVQSSLTYLVVCMHIDLTATINVKEIVD